MKAKGVAALLLLAACVNPPGRASGSSATAAEMRPSGNARPGRDGATADRVFDRAARGHLPVVCDVQSTHNM